jgi:hypothetical protein
MAADANGATSPAGDKHPGEIQFVDHVDGREWTMKATEVPQPIAWKQLAGVWHAVVQIESTGSPQHREVKSFGQHGEFLEVTMHSAPPGPPRSA